MNEKIIKFILASLFFLTILIGSIISTVLAQTPVIDIEEDKDTYIPNIYENYYYYVNPPGTDFTDVMYQGLSGQIYYTSLDYSGMLDYYNTFDLDSSQLFRNKYVDYYDSNPLRNTSRPCQNPFFNDEPYPRAVRMYSIYNPVFEQSQKKAINLHMDYSSTFIAEAGVEYFGFINSSDPFLLDVHVHDCSASGSIDFPSAFPDFVYSIGGTRKIMTYPVFPRSNSVIPLNFTLILGSTSLVTLTPHPWDFPDWIPTMEVNTTFSGEFEQGASYRVDEKTGDFEYPLNNLFSIRMYNLSLKQDEYYKIYVNYHMRDGSKPLEFLLSKHFEFISGDFDQNGYYFFAEESESVTLVLLSLGVANGDYTIFFQNVSPIPEEYETKPLILNTNITLELNTYYTFTFSSPHMMAINVTNSFWLDFYVQGAEPDDWIQISDWWTLLYSNLDAVTIDSISWVYIPTGTYAFEVTYFYVGEEIRFNTVPVQQPGALSVNQDSIFAIELPLVKNRINWVNLSTNDHIYPIQQVVYEWMFVGKYGEQIPTAYDWDFFGNENITTPGVWNAWDYNNTNIKMFLPTRDHEVPILMIRPFVAYQNASKDLLDTFSANLTVSAHESIDQHLYIDRDYIGDGSFIPLSAISATDTFNVNKDYTTDYEQIYGIPLNLDQFSIYNITIFLYGNNTLNQLNASFDDVWTHGGNLQDLEIFNSRVYKLSFTNTSASMLILTVTSTTYLYIDLTRDWMPSVGAYANATMEVIITKLTLSNMNFDLPDYEYNDTASNREVLTEDLLASQIIPPEMKEPKRAPGFGLVFTVGTLVILTSGISLKRRKRN